MQRCFLAVSLFLAGCGSSADVSLYVAHDEEHAKLMVGKMEEALGLSVKARYDTEAQKTVGLVSAIAEEASRPRCDVFWNNEIAHSASLARKGLLAPYDSPAAASIPPRFRDPQHRWTGFGARARVLIVNTQLLPDRAEWPKSIQDFRDPKWRGRCAIARPLTGTTLTHFTALRNVMGEEKFSEWLQGLFDNEVVFLQSNGATMRETAAGKIAFALTDTDDFHVALQKGNPVACVFPDQGDGQLGTMLIPNSVAIVANAPHMEAAKKAVDWILSEQTEAMLAASRSAQIPVRTSVQGPPEKSILPIGSFREMSWDANVVGADLDRCMADFSKRFGG